MAASERRIIELVLKAVGDEELKRVARDMGELKKAAQQSQGQLESLNKAFVGVSASAAGLWVGNKIQEGLQALISTTAEAVTEMNALAEAGTAAGSGLSSAAVGGAVELSKAMAELSAQIDNARNEFVGGLAPALTLIVKEISGAIGGMDGFYEAGRAVGQMLIEEVATFNKAIATLGAYAKAVTYAAEAASAAFQSVKAAATGDWQIAANFKRAALAYAEAATIYGTTAQEIGNAAAISTRAQGAALYNSATRTGYGTATGSSGPGGGAKGSGQRVAETQQQTEATRLMAETERLLNEQLAWGNEMYARRDALRANDIEAQRQYLAASAELERQQQAQAEALQKAQQEWGALADAMGQATYDVITGAESIKGAVKRMVASILADLARIAATKFILQLLGLGGPGGDIGSSIGSAFAKALFSAGGNAFGSGGIVSVPTMHGISGGGVGVLGEAGPEAIMPLARNSQGQLGVAAPAMNVTVINNVGNAAVTTRQTDQGLQIEVIERQLADRVRRGGSALPVALENTYANGRSSSAY